MAKPKKTVDIVEEKDTIVSEPLIIKVMTRDTKKVIKIDANLCPEYKTKYLHCMGNEFV